MPNKLIIANWKMNPTTLKEAEHLSRTVANGIRGMKGVEVVICPPFPYLSVVSCPPFTPEELRRGKQMSNVALGAQNCFYEQKGAYTGEVSTSMLKDMGCKYVIVGHSERKKYFGEKNETINKKLKSVLKSNLSAILCIGEETRDSFDSKGRWTKEIDPELKTQLVEALADIKKAQLPKISIAYEPVWAIGSGNPAMPDDVFSVKLFVLKILSELYDRKSADAVMVLYGGSTDKKNAAGFIKEGQIDGLLVGGSSLDAEEFIAMVKAITQ